MSVATEFVGANPRVLTNVLSVCLAADLAHQWRVELSVERLVLVCEGDFHHGVLLRANDSSTLPDTDLSLTLLR